jgi:hypothetical protein
MYKGGKSTVASIFLKIPRVDTEYVSVKLVHRSRFLHKNSILSVLGLYDRAS